MSEIKEEKQIFQYTYSAQQHEEIQKIREKYLSKEENKMDQLRRLDANASKPGRIVALTLGIIGMLMFGIGMCCVTVWGEHYFLSGNLIGSAGLILIGCAYPLYRKITQKQREKLAPQILRLTDELLQM